MKIIILIENSVNRVFPVGLSAEHGLSMLIEYKHQKILFDTGQTGKVVSNALRLGIDLKSISTIVLSHGHYDHTGGLKKILEYIQKPINIYAHPEIFKLHYTSFPIERYIGIPFRKEQLKSLGANFVWIRTPTEIFPQVFLSGEVPRNTPFEKADDQLFIKVNNQKIPDPMLDDMSLFIKTEKGLIIILGCAHSGVINIIKHAQEITKEKRIYGIIGGTHLEHVSSEQFKNTLANLIQFSPTLICANHCTGLSVALKLKETFGSKFQFATTGEVISF